MAPVRQAISDSGLAVSDISKVLLVGGSSRIPAVQESVKQITGKEPFKGVNPDECVAMGASLQGGVLAGGVKSLVLLDVTPLSMGIETVGGIFTKMINRNTTLPIMKSQIYTTAAHFQSSVDVHVLQGEREIAAYNKTLGKFRLGGIRRAPRGVPQIEVTFSIDVNGIVNVSAKDLGTGKQQQITITASSNMSQEDINKAVREAQQYAAEDMRQKKETTAKDNLERLIYQAESIKKKLAKDDKSKLEEVLSRAKKALKSKDSQAILAVSDDLELLLSSVGQYDSQNDASGSGSK